MATSPKPGEEPTSHSIVRLIMEYVPALALRDFVHDLDKFDGGSTAQKFVKVVATELKKEMGME